MFDATTPTSELEAVNIMLSLIGESPVNTLGAVATDANVQNALMLLRADTRQLLTQTWEFNTNFKVTLSRDVNGHILVPAGVNRIKPHISPLSPDMSDIKFTTRGDNGVMKLWDKTNNTFVWTRDLTVDTTFWVAFENLPEPFRWYLAIKAGRKFQTRYVGSETIHKLTEFDEAEALAGLEDYELDDANPNLIRDSADVVEGWEHY